MRRFCCCCCCCCLLDESDGRGVGEIAPPEGALPPPGRVGDLREESGVRSVELTSDCEADEAREPNRLREARPDCDWTAAFDEASLSGDGARGRLLLLLLPPVAALAFASFSRLLSMRFSLSC